LIPSGHDIGAQHSQVVEHVFHALSSAMLAHLVEADYDLLAVVQVADGDEGERSHANSLCNVTYVRLVCLVAAVRDQTHEGNDLLVPVDHRDPTALYLQLAAILRAEITSGRLSPHDPVPSESYLEQEHGVSRQTVRRAIAALREEGLIYTLPQRGSFVAEHDGSR
jgi:GntR family transcriptional regulator